MHSGDFPRIKKDDLVEDYPGVFDAARYVDVGIGWLPLVRDFVSEALPHDPSLTVHEMKEKFGTLRIRSDTDVLEARLAKGKAETKSGLTCEVCGAEGWLAGRRRADMHGGGRCVLIMRLPTKLRGDSRRAGRRARCR